MKSILILFQSVTAYLSILMHLLPLFPIYILMKKRVKLEQDFKIFLVYIIFTIIVQYTVTALAWCAYFNQIPTNIFLSAQHSLFRIDTIFQLLVFLYLLLKWAGKKKLFLRISIPSVILLIVSDSFSNTYYPDLMTWFNFIILLFVSFYLSHKMDNEKIALSKENHFVLIGIYLYCLISLIGITPDDSDFRKLGHILHAIAVIVSYYFYFRSFRCLYH